MPSSPIYRAAECVSTGRCADETFLLNKKTGQYYKLDDVGSEVWSLLRHGPRDMGEILRELSTVYELPPDQLADDVAALLATLLGYAVVETGR